MLLGALASGCTETNTTHFKFVGLIEGPTFISRNELDLGHFAHRRNVGNSCDRRGHYGVCGATSSTMAGTLASRYWCCDFSFHYRLLGVLLATLHGMETAIWAFAYLRLGPLNSFSDALFYSLELDDHAWRLGLAVGPALASAGRHRSHEWVLAVRYQHSVSFCGDARLLANADEGRCSEARPGRLSEFKGQP